MDQLGHNSKNETPDFLKRIKDTNSGYKLPNDYFSKMQANVLSQVIEPDAPRAMTFAERFQFLFQFKYQIATIAAIALFGFIILSTPTTDSIENQSHFSHLGDADFEYYLDNDLDTWNNQDLMAVLSEDEINVADFSIPISFDNALIDFPEEYIEDLDDESLLDFNLED